MERHPGRSGTAPALLGAFWAACLAGVGALALARGEEDAAPLKFEEAKETGLPEIMAAWKKEREDLEEKAHPGKKGSHWWWPTAVCVADLDGDGDADIVFAHHGAPGTRIFANQLKETGKLAFKDETKERTLEGTFDKMIGDGSPYIFDYDGDGSADIVAISDESPPQVARNDGKGRFKVEAAPFGIAQAFLMDVNGDGRVDVVLPVHGYAVYLNRGKGKYESSPNAEGGLYVPVPKELAFPQELQALAAGKSWNSAVQADLDGDGRPELLVNLAVPYGQQGLCCFRKAADGARLECTKELGLPYQGRVAAVQDFNGDGALDLLIVAGEKEKNGVYFGDGKGRFARSADGLSKILDQGSHHFAKTLDSLADFDEDGRPEMLTVHFRYGSSSGLFRHREGGRFEPANAKLGGCWQFGVCDMDGDGRLDIVGGTGEGPRILLNRTPAAGKCLNVKLKGPAENLVGLDAIVEAYQPGGMGDPQRLVCRVRNNTPGIPPAISVCGIGHSHGGNLPVHLGLGAVGAVDLRVTFPGGKTAEIKDVKAAGQTVEAACP